MIDSVTIGPQAKSWLRSLCQDGPTRFCLDAVKAALIRQGLAVEHDGVLYATNKGQAVHRAATGQSSSFKQAS